MIEAGQRAPDFTLPDQDGTAVHLGALAGRPVVLYFYPKDDTSGCTTEAIDFTALLPDFAEADAVVLGLSPDSPESHARFRSKHGLAVTLLSDAGKELLERYGVWVQKSMYGRSYMGVERTTVLVGRDGLVARIWRKVKVPGHAADVLTAVRAEADRAGVIARA